MPTPTFVAEYEVSTWDDSSPSKTKSVTTAVWDVLVLFTMASDSVQVNAPTGGTGLTWTLQRSLFISAYCYIGVWTAIATTAETFTLSISRAGTSSTRWGFNCLRFSGSGGAGASAVTNASGVPSLSLTTTAANSAIVVATADYNAVDGASRVWLTNYGAFTEKTYQFISGGVGTFYGGYHADSGAIGTKNVGLSAPGAQKYSIAAVELVPYIGPTLPTATATGTASNLGFTVKTPGYYKAGANATAALLNNAGGLPFTAIKKADLSITNQTTLQVDSELAVVLPASTVWALETYLIFEATSATDASFGLSLPLGATFLISPMAAPVSPSPVLSASVIDLGVTSSVAGVKAGAHDNALTGCPLRGTITMGSTAGQVAISFAQGTAQATPAILHTGSWMILTKVK